MSYKHLLSFILASVLVVSFVACQSPAATPSPAAGSKASAPAATAATPAAAAPAAAAPTAAAPAAAPTAAGPIAATKPGTPKYGGILQEWMTWPAPGFDPHRTTTRAPAYALLIFNSLIMFDPTKTELTPQNIVGDLAEKWQTSADGKTITFSLVKNAKWHDGKAFTADDVVYSIQKIMDPKRSIIYNYFPAYESVEKVDDYTVTLKLKYPSPGILMQFAGPFAVMQAKHSADYNPKSTDFLMGTGPFKFKSYTEPVTFEVIKNPDYFKKGMPYLDGIKMSIVTQDTTQVDVFVTNRVDMSQGSVGYRTKEQVDRIVKEAPKAVVKPVVFPFIRGLWLNMKNPAIKDVKVRRAMALVFDPEEIVVAGYGDPMFGWTGKAMLPEPWNLDKKEVAKIMWWDQPFNERVAEAKRLMKEAGYENGFKMNFMIKALPDVERMATAFSDQLRRNLNITSTINMPEAARMLEMRKNLEFDLYWDSVYALTGDLDEYAANFVTKGAANYGGYSNPQMDALFEKQARTQDLNERMKLGQEIERLVLNELPMIPSAIFQTFVVAWHPYVKGFTPGGSGYSQGHLRFEQVWLDK